MGIFFMSFLRMQESYFTHMSQVEHLEKEIEVL